MLIALLDSSEGASLIATHNIKHYDVTVTSNTAWQTVYVNSNTTGTI